MLAGGWSTSTKNAYEVSAKKWLHYTLHNNVNPVTPLANQCVDFLTEYMDSGVGYSSVNTSKSLLSSFVRVDGVPLGEHALICKYMKGVRREKPPQTRLDDVWDPIPVLHYLQGWGPIANLDLDRLSKRTMVLFLLATGQRLQALHLMLRPDMVWTEDTVRIRYTQRLKSNDPIDKPLLLRFDKRENENLCVFSHLKAYTEDKRTQPAAPFVFATIKVPTHRAKSDTLSNYVKQTLRLAGVHEQYTPYSIRHASTSAAARMNIPIGEILKSAGWSRESTFARFYNRPLHAPAGALAETDFIPTLLDG